MSKVIDYATDRIDMLDCHHHVHLLGVRPNIDDEVDCPACAEIKAARLDELREISISSVSSITKAGILLFVKDRIAELEAQ